MLNRRQLLRTAVIGGVAPFVNLGRFSLAAGSPLTYSARTIDLVQQSTVIDMLGLLTLNWPLLQRWQMSAGSFTEADFHKLRNSGITVFHPAVELASTNPYSSNLTLMWEWNRFLDWYPQYFVRVNKPEDVELAKKTGKIGLVLGFQNSDHFRSVEDVAQFRGLGQRVSQLTYNARNPIGSGCTALADRGLTEFGESIVGAMNKNGIAIDLSHTGDRTTIDTIEASDKPVLITHSNCRALVPHHPRCKSDEAIKRLAAKGGVMGITSIRAFVRDGEPTTIDHALAHFDHVARLVGVDHVGIGSDTDLDGRGAKLDIAGLNHPQRIFDLTEGLVRHRYSDAQIQKILGGNFQRVLKQIWS